MYYSQFGEDRILSAIFAGKTRGVCVEVGANNGVDGSTTLHFEEQGWDCVLVEPNPALCQALRVRRSAQIFECAASYHEGVATLHVAIGAELAHAVSPLGSEKDARRVLKQHGYKTDPVEVQTRTLDDILTQANLASTIDFISIDVEGHELEVLQGIDLGRWRPTIMIVEDNSLVWDGTVSRYLRRLGYARFKRTGVNDWYAHEANRRLGGVASRLGYYPAMIRARAFMMYEKVMQRLLRVPALRWLRNLLRKTTK